MKWTLVLCVLAPLACDSAPSQTSHIGYVEAEWLYVAAPSSGWLVESRVREGDVVAVGDTLFRLDDSRQQISVSEARGRLEQTEAEVRNVSVGARPAEIRALRAQLEEAKARLTEAKATRDRILPLVERGAERRSRADQVNANFKAAAARVESIKASIAAARLPGRTAVREAATAATGAASATVAAAEWNLEERTIKARVGGKVEQRFQYPGEFVVAGSPVLSLLPEAALKVRFFVAEAELATIAIGRPVQIRADGVEGAIDATVRFIASAAEFTPPVIYSKESRGKLVFLVEAVPADVSKLRPGLPVEVDWR